MHSSLVLFALAFLKLACSASLSGEATFYGGNVAGGACSFSTYTLPSGVFGTALSDSNWDTSGNCGACVSVTGPSGDVITAMIVDECPGCGTNHLDLFPDAFSTLADPSEGVIPVTWNYVDCPITTPLVVHNKDGVSAYWFSMQVVNANKGVESLEVSTDGGSTWRATARQDYNFFENSMGFGTTTVDVKLTSVDGDVVIVNDVNVSSGTSRTATTNFGSAPEPVPTFSAIPLESYTSTTSTAKEYTPTPSPTPEAPEPDLSSTTTKSPGGNFLETTAEATTSIYSTITSSTATSATYTPFTTSPEKTTSSTSTVTQTRTKTKTEVPAITLSTTAASVQPTSLAGGTVVNTTANYPVISSIGTSSSSLGGGLAATPSSSPLPFTGSASHHVAGGLLASLVLAILAAF